MQLSSILKKVILAITGLGWFLYVILHLAGNLFLYVGTGLAGAAAAASMGELGYNVLSFCFQDSPRRAHSIAAQ